MSCRRTNRSEIIMMIIIKIKIGLIARISHSSIDVQRVATPRRLSSTKVGGACTRTCRARGAQALRCDEPPHGGKTARGRAFVVGIGHPRRELSPERRFRAHRHFRSCRARTLTLDALVFVQKRGEHSLRALLFARISREKNTCGVKMLTRLGYGMCSWL